jgi:O-antigen ligase
MAEEPAQSLIGHSRAEWRERSEEELGAETAIHNHFVASLVNLGLLGGLATVGVLFVQPMWRIARRREASDADAVFVFTAGLGTIASLSFYEGFFSPSLMLVWALLTRAAFPPLSVGIRSAG